MTQRRSDIQKSAEVSPIASQDPTPTAEQQRLAELYEYAILDTAPETSFDDLALLASHICETPIALVSLVDHDRQWFKSKIGMDASQMPRNLSLCTHAIQQRDLFTINDTQNDARFASNPMLKAANFRFYAGAPLVTQSGEALGTLCVLDHRPRSLRPEQAGALKALARQVVSQLELRRTASINATLCSQAQRDARRRTRQALRDSLTGLPNRAAIAKHVARSLKGTHADDSGSAVMMVDLDRFKQVNDTLGHGVGDDVLRHVAKLLRRSVRRRQNSQQRRPKDIVARLGGDEFTILLNGLRSPLDADLVAKRIVRALSKPMEFNGHCVQIGASIGVARIEPRHESVDEVMREADSALYAAKLEGKGRHCTFDAQMHAATLREMRLELDLRDALAGNVDDALGSQLTLNYQPIVDVTTGAPIAFEALARWQHPDLGTISPAEFIAIAENTGQIVKLGNWVMAQACAQLAQWTRDDQAFGDIAMNVNVARRQLIDPEFVPYIRRVLEENRLSPSRLRLEITESSVMHDPEAASEALRRLRLLGVELYMDDFGTGHSSLGCLKRFPLDGLKIDRSFVSVMAESAASDAIVRAVMELARCFHMSVTAEGVETSEQWWLLRNFGCQSAQGYYFSRPLDATAATAYVLEQLTPRIAA